MAGRADIIHAMLELFSGATSPIPTGTYVVTQQGFAYGAWAIPGIQTIAKGEMLFTPELQLPVLYLLAPRSSERRAMTGWKFVDYVLSVTLATMIPGRSAQGEGGAVAIMTFYSILDALGAIIRGSMTNEAPKTLTTPSYPAPGEAVKFGEEFEIEEDHRRQENTVLIGARILIKATEQFSA